jgi:hypothetical protein
MAETSDSPGFEFYTVTVEELDGTTWTTIHIPKASYGTSALDCAVKVLEHDWPVSVYDADKGAYWRRWDRLKGCADTIRFTVTPTRHNRHGDSATLLLRELLAAILAAQLTEREARRLASVAAAEALAKAREEARYRQSLLRSGTRDIEDAVARMAAAGMTDVEIAAARKAATPRRTRKKTTR